MTILIGALAFSVSLEAHHSFAVFFDETKNITVSGTVTEFRFINPHALITVVIKRDGREETWTGETNAQTLLRRRGWTSTSLKAGDVVTLDGWPSRDGKPYMRVRTVRLADGTVVGGPAAGADRREEQR
jgi:hypothetical protein